MKTTNSISQKFKISALFSILAVGIMSFILMTSSNSIAVESRQVQAAITMDHLVNKGAAGFEQRIAVDPATNCSGSDDLNCAYDVTPSGKSNIPNQQSYSPADIVLYESMGWIQATTGSVPALYNN